MLAITIAVVLGVGLSAAAGFRVFVPLLAAALAVHFDLMAAPDSLEWIGSWPSIVVLGVACVLELAATLIPAVDHAVDAIAAPCATAAGAILMAISMASELGVSLDQLQLPDPAAEVAQMSPVLFWSLAIIVGGGAGLGTHAVMATGRAGTAVATAGIGNPVFAAIESLGAIIATAAAMLAPVCCAIIIVPAVLVAVVWFFRRRARVASSISALMALTLLCACDHRIVTAPPRSDANASASESHSPQVHPMNIHSLTVSDLSGAPAALSQFNGKVTLIVNLASECGFTPQYRNLEALQRAYEGKPFTVIGFPCNDFGGQEPGGAAEITACATNYGATFPIMGKVRVREGAGEGAGEGQSPLYAALAAAVGEAPEWNFGKYLVGRDGRPIAFIGTAVEPDCPAVRAMIDEALAGE